jgi:hypothetical protein
VALSHRERQILAEIELDLIHQDRAFSRRFDALEAAASTTGPQRFACQISTRELVYVLLAVTLLTAVWTFVLLGAGRSCTSAQSSPPTTSTTAQSQVSTSVPHGAHQRC